MEVCLMTHPNSLLSLPEGLEGSKAPVSCNGVGLSLNALVTKIACPHKAWFIMTRDVVCKCNPSKPDREPCKCKEKVKVALVIIVP